MESAWDLRDQDASLCFDTNIQYFPIQTAWPFYTSAKNNYYFLFYRKPYPHVNTCMINVLILLTLVRFFGSGGPRGAINAPL